MPASEKLVADLVRTNPHEVTVVCLGPASVLSRALDLCPEFPSLAKRIILVGGSLHEPGNAGPVSEFHFYCDPEAARRVLRCDGNLTLIPLDVLRQVLFSPSDLLDLPTETAGRQVSAANRPLRHRRHLQPVRRRRLSSQRRGRRRGRQPTGGPAHPFDAR